MGVIIGMFASFAHLVGLLLAMDPVKVWEVSSRFRDIESLGLLASSAGKNDLHVFVWFSCMTKTKLERDESSRTNHERTTRTSSTNHPETYYRQFPMVSVQKRWSKSLFFVHLPSGHAISSSPILPGDVPPTFYVARWTCAISQRHRVDQKSRSSSISHGCTVRPPYAKPLPVNYAGPVVHMRCSELQVVIERWWTLDGLDSCLVLIAFAIVRKCWECKQKFIE